MFAVSLRNSPRKPVCTFVALLLMVAGCSDSGQDQSNSGEESIIAIAAHEVDTRELSRPLSLTGLVQPREYVRIHARTSGILESILHEEGDTVAQGEDLARLDLAEQQAELARAQAIEEEAELTYQRTRALYQRESLSSAEYEQARSALAVARSETQLWRARVNFGRIRAPISGMVTERSVEPGEHVEDPQHLFTVANMESLIVRFHVSESDAAHLQAGDALDVTVDALPARTLEGEVRRVFPSADRDSRRVPIEVSLPADTFSQGVRPGYLVRTETRIDRRPDLLTAPTLAVGTEGTGDSRPFVFVVKDDELHRREVTPGITRGPWTEITEGLEPGEIILATNPRDRREGEPVRIVEWLN